MRNDDYSAEAVKGRLTDEDKEWITKEQRIEAAIQRRQEQRHRGRKAAGPPWAVIIEADGLSVIGPFRSEEAARQWVAEYTDHGTCHARELESPNEQPDHYNQASWRQ